jgi:hypothetical protein
MRKDEDIFTKNTHLRRNLQREIPDPPGGGGVGVMCSPSI